MKTRRYVTFASTKSLLRTLLAIGIFEGPTLERLDNRFDYPEERWYAIALVEGRTFTVIVTDLYDQTCRIISAWKAEKHEQKATFDHLEAEDGLG